MLNAVGDCPLRGNSDQADIVWQEHGTGGRAFVEARHPRALVGPAWPGVVDTSLVRSVEGRQVTLITDYQRACEVLTNLRWSRAAATSQELVGPASAMSVTEMDPPQHTRIRGLIGRAFTPRAVRLLQPGIEQLAADMFAEFRAAGPPADFVSQFCVPFAFSVHCDLLGVPEYVRPALLRWSLARSARPEATPIEVHAAELGLHDAVTDVLARQRRRGAEPGLFAHLLAARQRGQLTEIELTGLASSLFFDGHILAAAQLANAVLCLLLHPDQWRQLCNNPELIPAATDEVLRWSPSITVGMTRLANSPATDAVSVAFPLVNRDPAVFGQPDHFTITRQPNRHLSFGRGAHHCLGAHLMRTEMRIVLDKVRRELPDVQLAVAEDTVGWSASRTVRAPHTLPLHWRARSRL